MRPTDSLMFSYSGSGKREWQIGDKLSEEPDYYLDMPVHNEKFVQAEKFILEYIDILYLHMII